MDVKNVFGVRLKEYRRQRGLSQEQLAEAADISVRHLSTMERGLAFVSSDLLGRLSQILDVPVAAFFCGEDEKIIGRDIVCLLTAVDDSVKKLQQAIN
jgi:transcriptional regulator with XRE-family HTH domain